MQIRVLFDNLAHFGLDVTHINVEYSLKLYYVYTTFVHVQFIIDLFLDLLIGHKLFSVNAVQQVEEAKLDKLVDDLDTVSF